MNFWEELAQAKIEEEVPKGWLTMDEIAKEMKVGRSWACNLIRKAVEDGKVETQKFRLLRAGKVIPVPHYKKKA